MRKVTFGLANSLDNFIARDNGAVDWLTWTKELAALMSEYWEKVDTILMGRKTYDISRQLAAGGQGNPYPHIKCYVCSRTLPLGERDDIEIVGDAVTLLRKLRRRRGKEICVMGGGELARPLLEARLIDEMILNIHPVLLGSGVPLFHPMKRQIDLRLIECKPFKNGCVLLSYRVRR